VTFTSSAVGRLEVIEVMEENTDEDIHLCPICDRSNGAHDEDFCNHFWGAIYDHEFWFGPRREEFAPYRALWESLEDIYYEVSIRRVQTRLLKKLRDVGLQEVADALKNEDRFWWIDKNYSIFIDAKASLNSGTGYFIYEPGRDWFAGILRTMQRALDTLRPTPH
jgi:hypothetical protein